MINWIVWNRTVSTFICANKNYTYTKLWNLSLLSPSLFHSHPPSRCVCIYDECVCVCVCVCVCEREREREGGRKGDKRSISKLVLTDNFPLPWLFPKSNLPHYLFGVLRYSYIDAFPTASNVSMQTASSRIWIRFADSIFCEDSHYVKRISIACASAKMWVFWENIF